MKHPHTCTRNHGYQPIAKATTLLDGQYERHHRLSPQASHFLEGRSHRQLVDETINEYEAKNDNR